MVGEPLSSPGKTRNSSGVEFVIFSKSTCGNLRPDLHPCKAPERSGYNMGKVYDYAKNDIADKQKFIL